MSRQLKIVMSILAVVLLLASCGKQDEQAEARVSSIMPADCSLMPGDVVFRQGLGFESEVVMLAQGGEGMYSHCGMVVDSAGVMMIVHAVPGEPDFEGDVNRVKLEHPARFFMRSRAGRGEVMRYADSTVARLAAMQALNYYKRGMRFNDDYDDADTTRLYCTQLVVRAYTAAGARLRVGSPRHFAVPGVFDVTCILPVQLYRCGYFKSVSSFPVNSSQP